MWRRTCLKPIILFVWFEIFVRTESVDDGRFDIRLKQAEFLSTDDHFLISWREVEVSRQLFFFRALDDASRCREANNTGCSIQPEMI